MIDMRSPPMHTPPVEVAEYQFVSGGKLVLGGVELLPEQPIPRVRSHSATRLGAAAWQVTSDDGRVTTVEWREDLGAYQISERTLNLPAFATREPAKEPEKRDTEGLVPTFFAANSDRRISVPFGMGSIDGYGWTHLPNGKTHAPRHPFKYEAKEGTYLGDELGFYLFRPVKGLSTLYYHDLQTIADGDTALYEVRLGTPVEKFFLHRLTDRYVSDRTHQRIITGCEIACLLTLGMAFPLVVIVLVALFGTCGHRFPKVPEEYLA